MTLAHIFFVHMLYAGFISWPAVIGSIVPDTLGLVGWVRYLYYKARGVDFPDVDSWWDAMPQWAKDWYSNMHTIWFPMGWFVCASICGLFFVWKWWIFVDIVSFVLGYGLHIVTDVFTHRNDAARIVGLNSGYWFGIDWWMQPFYWTEVLAFVVLVAVSLLWWDNVVVSLII